MAKICPRCGGRVEDNAVKCDNCGFTPSAVMNNENINNISNKSSKSKKKNKKLVSAIVLSVCSAVIIICVGLIIGSAVSSGYKKAAENYFTAMVKCDFDLYWDSLSSLEYGGVNFEDRYSVLGSGLPMGLGYDAYLGVISSSIQAKTGEVKKVKVEIDNVSKTDKDELDSLYSKYVSQNPSLSRKDIKGGKSFDAKVTVKGENGETEIETFNLIALKENKKWRVFSLESDIDLASLIG